MKFTKEIRRQKVTVKIVLWIHLDLIYLYTTHTFIFPYTLHICFFFTELILQCHWSSCIKHTKQHKHCKNIYFIELLKLQCNISFEPLCIWHIPSVIIEWTVYMKESKWVCSLMKNKGTIKGLSPCWDGPEESPEN